MSVSNVTLFVTAHPWCSDPSRDEAVRAAEDAAAADRPILPDHRELPAAVEHLRSIVSGHLDDFAELLGVVGRINERVGRLEAMIPKTCSATSGPEHENKGDGMGRIWFPKSKREAPAPPAAPPTTKAATCENDFATEPPTGLRTERVTLEITHSESSSAASWAWGNWTIPGQSVRVVEEADRAYFPTFTVQDVAKIQNDCNAGVRAWQDAHTKALAERNEARDERDAAIREREELRDSYRHCRAANTLVCDERDALKARVAELESQLESVADRAAAAETALEAAPAASGWRILNVGETVQSGDEMADNLILNWCDASDCVGEQVTYGLLEFRRRVLAPAASGAAERMADTVDRLEAMSQDPGRTVVWEEFDDTAAAPAATGNSQAILDGSPAASGAAVNIPAVPVSSEPLAWGIVWKGKHDIDTELVYHDEESAQETADANDNNGTVVPLYAAPQPAKGWLTPEERKWIEYMQDNCVLPYKGMKCMEAILARSTDAEPKGWLTPKERHVIKRVSEHLFETSQLEFTDIVTLEAILARSTPPEVVRPKPQVCGIFSNEVRDAEWFAALAAAGHKVKEVGRE